MNQTKTIPKYTETKLVSDTISLYKTLIQVKNVLQNIYLSHQETTLLAYYAKHGISKETENEFIDNENISSNQIMSNLKQSLKKKGMIEKNVSRNVWEIDPLLKINLDDKVAIILKVVKK